MKAFIFAAGLGTRLRPLTDNLPKALAPVAGRTLLYYVIMHLYKAGVNEFVINIHHFADKIMDYVASTPELSNLDISFSDERDLLRDTGGGIRFAGPLLETDNMMKEKSDDIHYDINGCFLAHNVDIISDLDIRWFAANARKQSLATLLVSNRDTKRYLLFDDSMRLCGWTNVSTGEIKTPYPVLDLSRCRKLAFSGIHLISGQIFSVFDLIDKASAEFPLYNAGGKIIESSECPLGQSFPIIDFYLRAAAAYPIYALDGTGLTIIDAGKPDTLLKAESFLEKSISSASD